MTCSFTRSNKRDFAVISAGCVKERQIGNEKEVENKKTKKKKRKKIYINLQ